MARILCDGENKNGSQSRQIPFEVDDLKLVIQLSDRCVDCEKLGRDRQNDFDLFTKMFMTLTKDEVAVALLLPGKCLLNLLPQMVPCIGCRKSAERLFYQLQRSEHRALDPVVITPQGDFSIQHNYLFDSRSLFCLFHLHGPKLRSIVENIFIGKKSNRCNLHSLESHKQKTLGHWLDVWGAMSLACQETVLRIELEQLVATIERYAVKHKLCNDCKAKIKLAYNICIGNHNGALERGYCAALFENITCCPNDLHVHILNDVDFIADLLHKAKPDFNGEKRDQHVSTLDLAQGAILACLGIQIFERLHTINQKLRSEEQTWQILLHISVDVLLKSYQAALEKKQESLDLELFCGKLQEKEKRERNRQKKKRKKQKRDQMSSSNVSGDTLESEVPCQNSDHSFQDQCHDTQNTSLDAASKDDCQNSTHDSLSSKENSHSHSHTDAVDSHDDLHGTPSDRFRRQPAALEKKQESLDLELFCGKLQEKEKRERNRQKKKRKKQKRDQMSSSNVSGDTLESEVPCQCSNVGIFSPGSSRHSCVNSCSNTSFTSFLSPLQNSDHSFQDQCHDTQNTSLDAASEDDCQNSTHDSLSSKENSHSHSHTDAVDSHDDLHGTPSDRFRRQPTDFLASFYTQLKFQSGELRTLQELVDRLSLPEGWDDNNGISEEEINAFRTQQPDVDSKRREIRKNVIENFRNFRRRVSTV